jgi:L-2-hydroxyglutarate oxidase
MPRADVVIVGGGIVGLATGWKILQARPGSTVTIIEKETSLASHQTGHNSGVIHSGIYYQPGSLKATLCKRGAQETKELAVRFGVPATTIGKLLVATNAVEQERMLALYRRAHINGQDVELLDAGELRRLEPNIRGVGAIRVPTTGITDYRMIAEALAKGIIEAGGEIAMGHAVTAIAETTDAVTVQAHDKRWQADNLVVCAGLQADRMARLAGLSIDLRIIPFRGEYYALPSSRSGLVDHLIYPIPDPDLPFLGVHLSPTVDGGLTVGPNAVLGFAREKYAKGSVRLRDVADYATFPGMWRVARANVRTGFHEMRNSLFRRGYLAECRKYCPDLTLDDLIPREAGIRAQAVTRDGTLVHDFRLEKTPRSIHLLNAPSPAATSALPIGESLAAQVLGA